MSELFGKTITKSVGPYRMFRGRILNGQRAGELLEATMPHVRFQLRDTALTHPQLVAKGEACPHPVHVDTVEYEHFVVDDFGLWIENGDVKAALSQLIDAFLKVTADGRLRGGSRRPGGYAGLAQDYAGAKFNKAGRERDRNGESGD
jgi:hypothetical protein